MGFYLGLNALNFAEADRPFRRLTQQELAEIYFTLGLQCHFSIPYVSTFPMVSVSVRAAERCFLYHRNVNYISFYI